MPMLRAKCCILSERLNTKFYLPSERRLSSSARRSASLTRFRENPGYSYTVILTSILAAGIVQNTFAGEAGEG